MTSQASSPVDLAPPRASAVRVVPLGGLGEIGMNCLAIEQEDGILVVDCGVSFPDNDLGIDVVHPRFDWLVERQDRVVGIVLTHGHEDHIGALPYALHALDVPVYGPPHALELARGRLEEHGYDLDELDLFERPAGRAYAVGPFEVEPIRVTHSITDATALAIRTRAGLVLHTGDFKIDPTPPDGEVTDEARLRALGDEGVRLLLSDSTSIDSQGRAASERAVGEALEEIVRAAKNRVVIGMFASNVQRMLLVGDIAEKCGRRLCLLGRSVGAHARAAEAVGKLRWPSDLVVPPEAIAAMPKERVLIVASGTQGERGSALVRLAANAHPVVRLDPHDRVILSSRVIPGNDRLVFDLMGGFLRQGIDLVTRITAPRIHASGHAHRDEQLAMIEMTRPRAFVPVHGTVHHLYRHAELARDAGVEEARVIENGDVLEMEREGPLAIVGRVVSGKVATFGGEELGEDVLRERGQLGRSGVAFASLVLDRRNALATAPRIVALGVPAFTRDARRKVELAVARGLEAFEARRMAFDEDVAEQARFTARRAIEEETGARPVVLVSVTRP